MLRWPVKVQLVLFVIITLLGVSYVGAEYVGVFKGFGSDTCTVYADFTDSGGIFTNAEVTYRGVTVGRVGQLNLTDKGVQVALDLSNCSGPKIPVSSAATVSDRSVIGEQYVNLIPPNDKGPYMRGGEIIPTSRTTIPTSAEKLLRDLNEFVTSVDLPALRTTVSELYKALATRGPALGSLIDSSDKLVTASEQNLPTTIQLINYASKVLSTQLAEKAPLDSFTHSLKLLSQQLKTSDPDVRRLLDNGPADFNVIYSFVKNNRTDLGAVIANLATTGDTMVRHIDGIQQILELYPALAAGGPTTEQPSCGGEWCGRLGQILQTTQDPPDCGNPDKGGQGYQGTKIRLPSQTGPEAPNVAAHCTAPTSSGTNIRGSANVPGGDPISDTGGEVTYPRPTTKNTISVGDVGQRAELLGDRSWIAILTNAVG